MNIIHIAIWFYLLPAVLVAWAIRQYEKKYPHHRGHPLLPWLALLPVLNVIVTAYILIYIIVTSIKWKK